MRSAKAVSLGEQEEAAGVEVDAGGAARQA
jgi:hypothetical protein